MSGRRAALALLLALASLAFVRHRDLWFSATLAILLIASALWLCAVREVLAGRWQPRFGEAMALACAARLVVLPLAPALSDDVYRYLFEGRLVLAGLDPFAHAPNAPEVAHLRDAHFELINNKHVSSPYPPAVQWATAAGAWLGVGPLGIKLVFGAFDLATFALLWLLLRTLARAPQQALVHGLCPLVVHEFAGEGHSDSVTACALVGALLASARGRAFAAGVALACATAGKLIPVVLLPFLLRTSRRPLVALLAFAGVSAALWVPLAAPGMLDGVRAYAERTRFNGSVFALVHGAVAWLPYGAGEKVSRLAVLALGGALLAFAWRRRWPLERTALAFLLCFVACAPAVYPWYMGLVVPLLALVPHPALLAFCGSVLLAHHVVPGWVSARRWEENAWVELVEYAPLYCALVALAAHLPAMRFRNANSARRSSGST